jgi:hypothetical protein
VVARHAGAAASFVPAEKPRIAVAYDGTLAAIHEPTRVVVVELPGCTPIAEVGVDPESGASDVAWVGTRLAVLSRYAAHSTVHLLDPHGPRTIAEIRLEAPMKLAAAVGAHALAVGALGAAVLTATDTHLTPYQFPARTVPIAAGAAAAQFVVALAGSIEEWDPHSRMPKRRLKLPRPAVITAVGGSERAVWMTTQGDPTRLDVFALVNRGQPKFHELPEPIASVASHPRSDLVACLGADSGKLYVIDLDGRTGMRTLAPEGIDKVEAAGFVLGRFTGVLCAQARRPIVVVPLEAREPDATVGVPATLPMPRESEPPPHSTLTGDDDEAPASPPPTKPSLFRPPSPAPAAPQRTVPRKPQAPVQSLSERFSSWRDRRAKEQPRTEHAHISRETRPTWRDELVAWARGVAAGTLDKDPPMAAAVDAILARFELAPQLYPAFALLYGTHLGGADGVAPVDVARVLGRNWDEALGRGHLAGSGAVVWRDSRVRLGPWVQRALDGIPPRSGTIVGTPGAIVLLGPCVVVATDESLGTVAEAWLPAAGGAILAAHPGADVHELALEARAYGAVAMLPFDPDVGIPVDEPMIVVVTDDAVADALGLPRLG